MKVKLRRNRHNMSGYMLGTCKPGEIIPVYLEEVCPGDTVQHRINSLIRFLPMNAPIMHRVYGSFYTFRVPHRLVMEDFEDFITRTDDGITIPTMTLGNIKGDAGCARLFDYLGCQTGSVVVGSTTTVNILAARVYNAIYNEWFRDKDLVTPLDVFTTDPADFAVRIAAWRKDHFTAARPWPQLGADVTLPLGTSAPVTIDTLTRTTGAGAPQDMGDFRAPNTAGGLGTTVNATSAPGDIILSGTADLSSAVDVTVNALRRAVNLQALAERLGQFGHDYPSYLASMGVKSSDARLQRPEYLGGGKVPLSFSEVLQTAEGATTPVGEMRGHGIAPASVAPYRSFCEEHAYIMTVMVVRPDPIYSTVIPRHFFHGLVDGANDFYTPELERIGQQEIYNKELYPTNPAGGDATVWGYNNRYDEYRHHLSQVCSLLRAGQTLDYWTWARGFSSLPALNQTFIECVPSTDIFADTDAAAQNILYAVNNTVIMQRMLTKNITGRTI